MTRGLVHASYSLPGWQAVKLTFFAPCCWKPAKTSVFKFLYKHVNSFLEELIKIKVIFILRHV